jgi:hypothetical protein
MARLSSVSGEYSQKLQPRRKRRAASRCSAAYGYDSVRAQVRAEAEPNALDGRRLARRGTVDTSCWRKASSNRRARQCHRRQASLEVGAPGFIFCAGSLSAVPRVSGASSTAKPGQNEAPFADLFNFGDEAESSQVFIEVRSSTALWQGFIYFIKHRPRKNSSLRPWSGLSRRRSRLQCSQSRQRWCAA